MTTPSFLIDKDQEFLIFSPITTKILLWEDDHRDVIHARQNDDFTVDTRGLSFVFLFDYCVLIYLVYVYFQHVVCNYCLYV